MKGEGGRGEEGREGECWKHGYELEFFFVCFPGKLVLT